MLNALDQLRLRFVAGSFALGALCGCGSNVAVGMDAGSRSLDAQLRPDASAVADSGIRSIPEATGSVNPDVAESVDSAGGTDTYTDTDMIRDAQVQDVASQDASQSECASVRCGQGEYCGEDAQGARCLPYVTCATVKCAAKVCIDLPAECERAPCPPTKPHCLSEYVCPPDETIYCMPGAPRPSLQLCIGDFREWIVANCPGVRFVD